MTKQQRMDAAIQGKPVDHVPVLFSLHFAEEYHQGKKAVEAHRKFYSATDVDALKIMNENLFRTDTPVKNPEDWRHVRPITGKEPYVQDQFPQRPFSELPLLLSFRRDSQP